MIGVISSYYFLLTDCTDEFTYMNTMEALTSWTTQTGSDLVYHGMICKITMNQT